MQHTCNNTRAGSSALRRLRGRGTEEDKREALGETVDGLDPLERLLRCGSTNAHEEMADCLWEAPSDEIAMEQLVDLSKKSILEFEAHERDGSGDRDGGRSEVEG